MRSLRSVSILGLGSYAPARILTNDDLAKTVDTSDEWITTRTGIKKRHMAAQDEAASDLALEAARRALDHAQIDPESLDMVIVATLTPDMFFPSTACHLQRKLQAFRASAFDVSAACSGFLYGLSVAQQFIATGQCNRVLLVGTEKLSPFVNWNDRSTCVLFGDAAGAVVLGHEPGRPGILGTLLGADGRHHEILRLPGGGSCFPPAPDSYEKGLHHMQMSGREVFKLAVIAMQNAALEILARTGLKPDDIDCFIPHQANIRIIEAIAQRLDLDLSRFFINVQDYGNTSAASIPVAFDEAVRQGRIKRGDKVLLVAFGGGLTWASGIVEY